MNYKLEKFWNLLNSNGTTHAISMNYKLEKFWNTRASYLQCKIDKWTINLKSFEIVIAYLKGFSQEQMN